MKTILSFVIIALFLLGMYSFRSIEINKDLNNVKIESISDADIALGDTAKTEKKTEEMKREKKCDKKKHEKADAKVGEKEEMKREKKCDMKKHEKTDADVEEEEVMEEDVEDESDE